jgi:hypothetical protein
VRGLLAAGVPPTDPAIKKACRMLRSRQRADGGFAEHHDACISDTWVEGERSQIVQTAWALTTLLEAHDPDDRSVDRAAAFLAMRQEDDGGWPIEEPAGVFFETALIHYDLYRSYFPVHALALHETRRLARMSILERGSVQAPSSREARAPEVRAEGAADSPKGREPDVRAEAAGNSPNGRLSEVRAEGAADSPKGRQSEVAS